MIEAALTALGLGWVWPLRKLLLGIVIVAGGIGLAGVIAVGWWHHRLAVEREAGVMAERAVWQEAVRKADAERTIERQEAERRLAAKDAALAAEETTDEREQKDLRNDLDAAIASAGPLPPISDRLLTPLRRQSR